MRFRIACNLRPWLVVEPSQWLRYERRVISRHFTEGGAWRRARRCYRWKMERTA